MRLRSTTAVFGLLLVLAVVLRCAWVSDDAYITLRVADNVLAGWGPRWNVVERVQAFTHPLWLAGLTVAYAAIGDAYTAAWSLGLLTTACALFLVVAHAEDGGLPVALGALVASKAFVDYGTSGLENPLTHLLLAALLWTGRRPDLRNATLVLSLLALTRPDAALFAVPMVGWLAWRERAVGPLVVGLLPLLLWEVFSVVYYGSPVPNTALAKLAHGVPRAEVLAQGLRYLEHTLWHDPPTLALMIAAPALAVIGPAEDRALAAGAVLYAAWVVFAGGDFMAGRFWTGPAFVGALLIARRQVPVAAAVPLAIAAVAAGTLTPGAPVRAGPDYTRLKAWHGIVDERGYYHRAAGLFGPVPGAPRPAHKWVTEGRDVREAGGPTPTAKACVGYFGFFAGPGIQVIDRLALTDPLLARLPAEYDPSWRIGHFRRGLPPGYATGAPRWDDPALANLARDVHTVTRGPLFSAERWVAMARLWTAPSGGIDPDRYRFHAVRTLTPIGPTTVPERGIAVPVTGTVVEIVRGRGPGLRVLPAAGLHPLASWDVPGTTEGPRFQPWTAPLPPGTDHVLLFPLDPKKATAVRRVEGNP